MTRFLKRPGRGAPGGSCVLSGDRLFLHPGLLERRELRDKLVIAEYSCFSLKRAVAARPALSLERAGAGLAAEREVLAEVSLPNFAAKSLFKGVFAQAEPPGEVIARILKASGGRQADLPRLRKASVVFYLKFEGYEFLSKGLPDYFPG